LSQALYLTEKSTIYLGAKFVRQGRIKWGFAISMANTAKNKLTIATVVLCKNIGIYKN